MDNALSASLPYLLAIPVSYGFYHYYVDVKWPADLRPNELAIGELFCCTTICAVLVLVKAFDLDFIGFLWVLMVLILGGMAAIEAILYFKIQARKGAIFCSFADYIATITGV